MASQDEQLELALEDFDLWVRGGRTPDEAAARLARYKSDSFAEQVLETYKSKTQSYIKLSDPRVLESHRHIDTWYAGPDFAGAWCWPRYRQGLYDKGWAPEAVSSIDDASTKILAHLPHPNAADLNARGLVVGYVQSGKTANYSALIAKAADAGYRFFIVLAGMTNSLRGQTQRRLEREVVKTIERNWGMLTSATEDFRGGHNPNFFLNPDNYKSRVLCVVKKNTWVLERLRRFFERADDNLLHSCPVMIIDDEADQASVNTKQKARRRSTINRRIVNIIDALPKVVYLGYTATPFANLFIDPSLPKDLYPRDYIFDLPRPARYFGSEMIFGRENLPWDEDDTPFEGLNVIRDVLDEEAVCLKPPKPSQRSTFDVEMTRSLDDAIRWFLLATAQRLARGHEDHSSMLVHTALYTSTHDKLHELISNHFRHIRSRFQKERDGLMDELKELWDREFPAVTEAHLEASNPVEVSYKLDRYSFSETMKHFEEVLDRVEILIDNGRVEGLDYEIEEGEDHRFVIAIGGNTLSRGLTLEGLIVSYFIRTSAAYDTLLQMSRWFGFRVGYEDLPRVWMTEELQDAFYHLATVEKEIRQDIQRYEKERISPIEFGVRVRTHPKLAITSRLKMQNVHVTSASYEGKHLQTFLFKHDDKKWLKGNLKATRELVGSLAQPEKLGAERYLFREVSNDKIINFLQSYKVVEEHADLRTDLLVKYIRAEEEAGKLRHWNVGIFGSFRGESSVELGLEEPIRCVTRTRYGQAEPANIRGLTSPSDRTADTEEEPASQSTLEAVAVRDHDPQTKSVGLLMIYPIDKDSEPRRESEKRSTLDAAEHVIGVGLMFPTSDRPQSDYVVNDFQFLERGENLMERLEEEDEVDQILDDEDQQEGAPHED